MSPSSNLIKVFSNCGSMSGLICVRVAPESTCHTVAMPFTITGMYAPKVAASSRDCCKVFNEESRHDYWELVARERWEWFCRPVAMLWVARNSEACIPLSDFDVCRESFLSSCWPLS